MSTLFRRMENGQISDKRFGSQLPPPCQVPSVRSRDDVPHNLGRFENWRHQVPLETGAWGGIETGGCVGSQ